MADYTSYGTASADWIALEPDLPVPPTDQSLPELIKVTNSGREAVSAAEMKSQGLADAVSPTTHSIPMRDGSTIQARSYRPRSLTEAPKPLPIYLNLHGGGFLFGTIDSEDAACSRIVHYLSTEHNFPIVVLNVNYRHTPEHTFPTAFEDVEDALVWLHSLPPADLPAIFGVPVDRHSVVIGGISAGGQLSASMTLQQHLKIGPLASLPRLKGQVLIIPCLVHIDHYSGLRSRLASPEVSSYVTQKDAPVLPVSRIRMFTDLMDMGKVDPKDRRLNVGNASREEVKGMPPSVFGIAGADPLRDEGLFYAEMLADEG